MDPIFDRLGRLLRSNNPFSSRGTLDGMDDDQRAAYEELEAELNAPKGAPPRPSSQGPQSFQEKRRQETRQAPPPPRPTLDPKVASAYATLEVAPGATWDQINASHRVLLKKHHPDRHAGDPAKMAQATAQAQKINEAYQVLKKHLGQ